MAFVFWAAVVLLLHTYFLYPLMLVALDGARQAAANARFLKNGRDRRRRSLTPYQPAVTLVVPAYNEEDVIQAKLDNSLSIQWPDERFEVLVGSDGSTDRTEPLVAGCPDPRVRLSSAARGGKLAVLNRCIPMATGDIVVLTDANTMIDKAAVERLVGYFKDPDVGAVCGSLKLYNRKSKEYEESTYWAYESLIKFYEGKAGAVLGANGGLYAIRKELFEPLPREAVVDDFIIPVRILEKGYRVVYAPEAVAYEETTENYGQEFGRRARIAAGNFQALRMFVHLLSPTKGFVSFAFWSHKVLRWLAPALMAVALAANAALLGSGPFYQALFVAQLAFYALAWLGRSGRLTGGLRRIASTAYYFVYMNVALAAGFWRFVRGTQKAAWERTART